MADRVVIAGGGTGGHLYPGIALAKALMKHDSKLQIVFVGTRQGLESRALPREGFPLKTIVSGGLLGKRGWARFMAWARLPVGFVQSLVFLAGRRPRLVVGVGGYVSGPLVAAAWLLRIPTLIHEQNAHPGITNRLLGRGVDRVALTFEDAARFFPAGKWTVTGNLIRETFARAEPPQPPSGRTSLRVLLLGGSLGAHSINIAMIDALEFLGPLKERLSFVHQTGEADAAFVKAGYERRGFAADVAPFLFDVEARYREADLVICRAGATTLAELTALGKPAVLIPFPYATHNHQEKNARVLEAAGAAVVLLDREMDGKKLGAWIRDALEHPDAWNDRVQASYQLGRRDATERVRRLCLDLMDRAAA